MKRIMVLVICIMMIVGNAYALDANLVQYIGEDTDLVKFKTGNRVGIIDMKGNMILEPEWYDITYLNDQMALGEKDDVNYLIDLAGGTVNEVEADEIRSFSEGLAPARFSDKWGYIDRNGELVIDTVYDLEDDLQGYDFDFTDGIACVRMGEKLGYINTDGEAVIPIEYDYASRFYECGLAEVWIGHKSGLINRDGELVADTIWDAMYLEYEHDGKIIVSKDDKYGVMDTEGNIVIEPEWSDIFFYKDEFVAINDEDELTSYIILNGIKQVVIEETLFGFIYKQGVLGVDGIYVVEPIYDRIWEIGMLGEYENNGYLGCELNDKCGVINPDGELITEIIYDSIPGHGCGFMRVEKKGKYGYINGEGEQVIECMYSDAGDFEDGYAIVKKGWYYGVIDAEGNTVLDFAYDDIRAYKYGNALVRKGTRWDLIDGDGNSIIDDE